MGDWIRSYRPVQEGLPYLVCFPHAGGSATFFFPVATALTGRANVLAVQYPGRQDRRREPPIDDVVKLAEQVHRALQGYLGAPMVFFGHSMGAIVAYEVARLTPPSRLVVSGRRAPSRPGKENVHLRDDAGVLAELRSLSGTDPSLLDDEEVQAMILPAVRADYRANESYVYAPGPPLPCPITAFVGNRDPYASTEEVSEWAEHTCGGFAMEVFEGDHFYLTARPYDVINRLSELLGSLG